MPEQDSRRFANDMFKCIFLKENFSILIQFSLKLVPKGLIDNKSALVQVMVWHKVGCKSSPNSLMNLSVIRLPFSIYGWAMSEPMREVSFIHALASTTNGVRAWMSNYIPHKTPCPNLGEFMQVKALVLYCDPSREVIDVNFSVDYLPYLIQSHMWYLATENNNVNTSLSVESVSNISIQNSSSILRS